MRGYDPALVDDFLDLVADRLDELVRENLALSERVGRQDQQVAEYRERERALTEALVTAQEMREEMRRQTSREAEAASPPDATDALELYEGVAEDVSSDGVPGPIGLSSSGSVSAGSTWTLEAEWSVADLELTEEAADVDPELAILGGETLFEDEDEDEDATRLLRNAEEAGYRLDGDDEDELLLLEDAILEEQPGGQAADEQDDTDEWLGTFLEDK
jgi:hypothetical protein